MLTDTLTTRVLPTWASETFGATARRGSSTQVCRAATASLSNWPLGDDASACPTSAWTATVRPLTRLKLASRAGRASPFAAVATNDSMAWSSIENDTPIAWAIGLFARRWYARDIHE